MTSEEQKAYECDCIENGERFVCTFKSKTTNKEELYKIGVELASGWGAECISVKQIIPHSDEPMENIYDVDKDYTADEILEAIIFQANDKNGNGATK